MQDRGVEGLEVMLENLDGYTIFLAFVMLGVLTMFVLEHKKHRSHCYTEYKGCRVCEKCGLLEDDAETEDCLK